MIVRHTFTPHDNTRLSHLCGPIDEHLRTIEAALQVSIAHRHEQFKVDGPKAKAQRAMEVLQAIYEIAERPVKAETVQLMLAGDAATLDEPPGGAVSLHTRRADLRARTPNQTVYLDNIATHDITFGIGPAGTGKTYLAVACAVDALERAGVQRIVLTRPAVEAGERLGFLPGDLSQKVDPYLRPLYDALYDLMGFDRVQKAFERNALEIAPLAFMRGRTLNNAFVILDEAQNTTDEDVPDPHRLRRPRRGHRGRQPDRPAQGPALGPDRGGTGAPARQGHRHHPLHQRRRGAPSTGGPHRGRLRRPWPHGPRASGNP
jgi:phosphate starvation-inducible PhoH-like protein